MLRTLRAWIKILTGLGPVARVLRQGDSVLRYHFLRTLGQAGLLNYLQEPRSYGQILAQFNFVDNVYTQDLFELLVSDKVLLREEQLYNLNPAFEQPSPEDMLARTDPRFRPVFEISEAMMYNVVSMMRGESLEMPDTFDLQGRQLVEHFDSALGSRVYTALRNAAFAFLRHGEEKWLHGKKLLDVGCGSGREVAELWLRLGGEVFLTAVDPASALLDMADQNFESLLASLNPDHPPVTPDNRPRFVKASAHNLPFANDEFDAVFHSAILHWTPDPPKSISEISRVAKAGGLVFGTQAVRPNVGSSYQMMVTRSSGSSYGFFWKDDYLRWYAEHGFEEIEMTTIVGVFRGRKSS